MTKQRKRMSWMKAKRIATADATCVQLARAWRDANRSGTPDRTCYDAWLDRCQELGIEVPNAAYWSFLMDACLSA